ncbi:MAG: corrinoid protein [Anaerolineales bacterium]|nr:corrinoid protein [Anaerolineales bacterium]
MDSLEKTFQFVVEGHWKEMPDLAKEALDAGNQSGDILKALVSGMDTVSEEWRVGNMFIPEVLISAKAMHAGMDIIRPHLSAADVKLRGVVVIGTVQGDLHDIGKSLVGMMMEGGGFQVYDLGVDVSAAKFVEAVKEHEPDIVGMSSLLTTTLPFMRDTIRSLEEAGLRDSIKILIGGAPVTPEFAESIGADGYAPDGATAVDMAHELVG